MMTKTIASVGLALIFLAIPTEIQAKPQTQNIEYDRHNPQGLGSVQIASLESSGIRRKRKHEKRYREKPGVPKNYAAHNDRAVQIVAHPEGCPRRSFCGCGTALRLLGKAVAEGGLAIAKNWLDFPRAACAPNTAAARSGHVFAIIECLSGNRALAYDPNSGGHQTRIHVRDLSRYHIVNPHGSSRYAEAP